MRIEEESAQLGVLVGESSKIAVAVEPEHKIDVIVGEAAKMDCTRAINYIKSGTAEIGKAVEDGIEDFNINAVAKTGAFNTNVANKTNTFNQNATNKTQDFNDNATSKTASFNSNATDKTTAFNDNATNKTTAFNNNSTSKTGDFNTNATNKTNDFNDNYTSKKALIDAEVQTASGYAAEAKQWATGDPTEPVGNSAKYWANEASSTFSSKANIDLSNLSATGEAKFDAKQNVLTAGTGINITGDVISATNTGATWGNITGTLSNQTDLNNVLTKKLTFIVGELPEATADDVDKVIYHVNNNNEVHPYKGFESEYDEDEWAETSLQESDPEIGGVDIDISVFKEIYHVEYGQKTEEWWEEAFETFPTFTLTREEIGGSYYARIYWDAYSDVNYMEESINQAFTFYDEEWEEEIPIENIESASWEVYYYPATSYTEYGWISLKTARAIANWGNIQGSLTSQTDLSNALNAKQATLVSGTNIKTINNNSILGSGDLSIGGGSNRNVGEIVQSTIPLSDAGLHLLDGSIISGGGSYDDFITYVSGLVSTYPDLFETEANWQSSVTNYGVCGKFVYDSINGTLRLPKITGFTESTISPTTVGDLTEAGLPNIAGSIGGVRGDFMSATGAFAASYGDMDHGGTGITSGYRNIDFSASDSNSIYGNSLTVQPQTIKVLYYIVVATSTKTDIEVDIDEIATDLNGKADTDLSNITTTGKTKVSNLPMPSSSYVDLTLGASGDSYTAPANGWVVHGFVSSGAGQHNNLGIKNNGSDYMFVTAGPATASYQNLWTVLPVKKGDVFYLYYGTFSSVIAFRFIYAQGEI